MDEDELDDLLGENTSESEEESEAEGDEDDPEAPPEALEAPETGDSPEDGEISTLRKSRLPNQVLTAPTAMSTETAERLASEWGLDAQQVQLMDYLATQRAEAIFAHRMQSHMVANAHYQAEVSANPEFYREYGPDVQRALSQLPPELQGTRKGVRLAALYVLNEEAGDEGSIGDLLTKAGGYTKAKPAATKPAKPPTPPKERIPTPTLGGNSRTTTRPRDGNSTLDDVLGDMFGIKGTEKRFLEMDERVKK